MGPRPVRRLLLASSLSVGLVAGVFALPSLSDTPEADRLGSHRELVEAERDARIAEARALAPDDGHDHGAHRHDNPATKNAITRAGLTAGTEDPTTAEEARTAAEYVERQRALPDPELRTVPVREPRREVPQTRYAMAGGCYTIAGRPIHFQATTLGVYLLFDAQERFLTAGEDGTVTWAAEPSEAAEWVTRMKADGFVLRTRDGRALRSEGGSLTTGDQPTPFELRSTTGCAAYPEVEVNVDGLPHAGVTPYQEVRGYVDAHTHGMAFEFLGGKVHCGRPWHEYGAPYALVDCEDHKVADGNGAVLENFLRNGTPTGSHDPVGWPTFEDWPAPHSLTHEGTYYTWMERAWRSGQRIFVNLLVENGQLCRIYPLKKNSCDEMESIRLQATRMRQFERYIDAQYGGPGQGWYRIVENPWEARRVINQGKLAVVMGIETSVPFGCTFKRLPLGDVPQCDIASIDRQIQEIWDLGVRQMEIVNKFDNALTGVAGDAGQVGVAVNSANFLETGSFWDMRHCEPEDGESSDKPQMAAPEITSGQQDALFGAVAALAGQLNLPRLPLYGTPPHCNARGLTDLGAYVVNELADRHVLIDPDHMSVEGRNRLLDILEERGYPGVLSSHSWSTPDAYPRIYELGGFVAPYAGDAEGFLRKWQRHLGWADPNYYFGFGFGADINGLGAQGDPRHPDEDDDVDYPFTGLNGVEVHRQHSGQQVYDINVDGVAHYGLYPDWIEDLRVLGGAEDGGDIVADMARGAEAYLQTWERAYGIAPDPCRNPGLRLDVREFRDRVTVGMTPVEVLRAVGQPWQRLGTTYTTCVRTDRDPRVEMTVVFSDQGRVAGVRRS